MSKHEDWMIEAYWNEVGGTIVKEFLVCPKSKTAGMRLLDAVILPRLEKRFAKSNEVELKGQEVIVVQAKAKRLGMSLMGQALFSAELIRRFSPSTVRSVALCLKGDSVLAPLLEKYKEIEIRVLERQKQDRVA